MPEWITTARTIEVSVADVLMVVSAWCLVQITCGFLRAWRRDRQIKPVTLRRVSIGADQEALVADRMLTADEIADLRKAWEAVMNPTCVCSSCTQTRMLRQGWILDPPTKPTPCQGRTH